MRCRLVAADHPRSPFARDVQAILQRGLAVRDRYHAGVVSAHGLAVARGHLITCVAERLGRPSSVLDVQRFAAHLTREFPAIWSFLFDPTIDATNCVARGSMHRMNEAARDRQSIRLLEEGGDLGVRQAELFVE